MKSVISIYLSYTPEDALLVHALEKHLFALKHANNIELRDGKFVHAGQNAGRERYKQLAFADVILLCISANFLSNEICEAEMEYAIERHRENKTLVLPIILRPVYWMDSPIKDLLALPEGGMPVTSWPDLDEAFVRIVGSIRTAISNLKQGQPPSLAREIKTPDQVLAELSLVDVMITKSEDSSAFIHALQQYHKDHANEQLAIVMGDEIIYYSHFVQVVYAWQCWQLLTTSLSTQGYISLYLLEELVRMLSTSLLATQSTDIALKEASDFYSALLDTRRIFSNTRISGQLPILLYKKAAFDENAVNDIRFSLQEIVPEVHFSLLLLFLEPRPLEGALITLKHRLNDVYACGIIPVTQKDFLRIIDAEVPQKIFRQHILSKVDLRMISPFVVDGPTPNSMFFGREHELHVIQEQIKFTSYALIGGRRIGKTSIMKRLLHTAQQVASFRAFFHDCSYTNTEAELLEAVTFDRSWFPASPQQPFPTFTSAVQALPYDKPVAILLDEVDKLVTPDRAAGYPLLRMLRSLVNTGQYHLVISGEFALHCELQDSASPLYNLATELVIGNLDMKAVHELVVQPMREMEIELSDEEMIVKRIWMFTAGHPNVVQRLCQRLILKLNEKGQAYLTLQDVEDIIVDVDFLRKDFLNIYWERATVLERLCSLIMAKEPRLHTLTTIDGALKHLNIQAQLNDTYEALERLVELRNILTHTDDGGYTFAVPAFPEVIARTSSVNDAIALISEKYRSGSSY